MSACHDSYDWPEDVFPVAGSAFEAVDEAECWRLLSSQTVGRIAVIVDHYPLVFPVNHTVDRHNILFRTAAGTKLWALQRSHVTFEVDGADTRHHTGWSVLVRGSAREVDWRQDVGPSVSPVVAANAHAPWPPGERHHLVRIVPDAISGRRIRVVP